MNNYYDVLNVVPEAARAEIIDSYQRLKKVFTDEQPAIYGLYTNEMLAEKIQELDLAYQVLSDTTKRENYDKEIKDLGVKPITAAIGTIVFGTIKKIEEEQPKEPGTQIVAVKEKKPVAKKDKAEDKSSISQILNENINGAVLARIRKEKKISLEDVFEETKIKVKILEDIENDLYERLPARPYLRGFLTAFALYLKIDANKVISDYLQLFDDWKAGKKNS
jgi:DnaJ-class molecular chaperone